MPASKSPASLLERLGDFSRTELVTDVTNEQLGVKNCNCAVCVIWCKKSKGSRSCAAEKKGLDTKQHQKVRRESDVFMTPRPAGSSPAFLFTPTSSRCFVLFAGSLPKLDVCDDSKEEKKEQCSVK